MTESLPNTEPGLLEFLAMRARRASDGRLAVESGIGFVLAVVAAAWRPGGWPLFLSAGVCALAFGLWGITDRELRERSIPGGSAASTLRVARVSVGVIGGVAAVALATSFLFLALGTIIS